MGLEQTCIDRQATHQFEILQPIVVKPITSATVASSQQGLIKCDPYPLTEQAEKTYKQFSTQFNNQYLDIQAEKEVFREAKESSGFYKLSVYDACYHGEWKNNKPHGKGIAIFPNGSILVGTFIQGYCSGEHNYFIFVDGSYYIGNIYANRFEGKGKLVNQNIIYEGTWSHNLPHGQGIQSFSNGDKYIGKFQRGLKHGLNELFLWGNNQKLVEYKGQFKQGRIKGEGTLVLKNKMSVFGNFDQETISNCTFTSQKYKFKGNYSKGKLNGGGVLEVMQPHEFYHGNFTQGKLTGQFKIIDAKGREANSYFFENRYLKAMVGLTDRELQRIIKIVENSYHLAQRHSDALIQICQQLDEDYQCKFIEPFDSVFNTKRYVVMNLFDKVLLIKAKQDII